MKFTSQEEYGIRCLLQVARSTEPVSICDIAHREHLTDAHVAKLLRLLRCHGLVNSIRGQSGGYVLAKDADEITIADVLACLGGRLLTDDFCNRHAGRADDCAHTSGCSLRALWAGIDEVVQTFLTHFTVADLICGESDVQAWVEDHIERLPHLVQLGEEPTSDQS